MNPESDQPDARARVLAALMAAGEQGITTWNLIHATHHSRAVGRVWELTKEHDIEHIRERGNVHRWVYRGPRARTLLALMEA